MKRSAAEKEKQCSKSSRSRKAKKDPHSLRK
jgi:hypothetical protein